MPELVEGKLRAACEGLRGGGDSGPPLASMPILLEGIEEVGLSSADGAAVSLAPATGGVPLRDRDLLSPWRMYRWFGCGTRGRTRLCRRTRFVI